MVDDKIERPGWLIDRRIARRSDPPPPRQSVWLIVSGSMPVFCFRSVAIHFQPSARGTSSTCWYPTWTRSFVPGCSLMNAVRLAACTSANVSGRRRGRCHSAVGKGGLLCLFGQHGAEDLPGQVLGDADLFERLVRSGWCGTGPAQLRRIHARVSWMLRTVERSITVSAPRAASARTAPGERRRFWHARFMGATRVPGRMGERGLRFGRPAIRAWLRAVLPAIWQFGSDLRRVGQCVLRVLWTTASTGRERVD